LREHFPRGAHLIRTGDEIVPRPAVFAGLSALLDLPFMIIMNVRTR